MADENLIAIHGVLSLVVQLSYYSSQTCNC